MNQRANIQKNNYKVWTSAKKNEMSTLYNRILIVFFTIRQISYIILGNQKKTDNLYKKTVRFSYKTMIDCLERELCAYLYGVVRLCLAGEFVGRYVSIV